MRSNSLEKTSHVAVQFTTFVLCKRYLYVNALGQDGGILRWRERERQNGEQFRTDARQKKREKEKTAQDDGETRARHR